MPFPTSLVVKNGSKILIGMSNALTVVRERHFNKVAGFGGRDFNAERAALLRERRHRHC